MKACAKTTSMWATLNKSAVSCSNEQTESSSKLLTIVIWASLIKFLEEAVILGNEVGLVHRQGAKALSFRGVLPIWLMMISSQMDLE